MIEQSLELNIIPGGVMPIIYVNQNDDSGAYARFFFTLIYNGEVYAFDNSATFKLRGTKPDKNTFEISLTKSGTTLKGRLYTTMDDVPGDVYCNIEMIDGSDRVGTQAFIMRVQKEAKE